MKKVIIKSVLLSVMMALVMCFAQVFKKSETPNDLILENIKALAGGAGSKKPACIGQGSVVCTGQDGTYIFVGEIEEYNNE